MRIDSHCHIFNERIVANVREKPAMLAQLKLNTDGALQRLAPEALQESARANGFDLCVLLPSASPTKVRAENDRFIGYTRGLPRLRTLGTLHPEMDHLQDEIDRILDLGINGFKFSSFSQRFEPLSDKAESMLAQVERAGRDRGRVPVLLYDTFATAHVHFAADPGHLTTPSTLARLALRHPGINFIGAHMGGLTADFDDIRRFLVPAPNLYLDTANAAHTLEQEQFIELLRIHGSEHILFGTDWPWFMHGPEQAKVADLLTRAGYSQADQANVFGGNAKRVYGV